MSKEARTATVNTRVTQTVRKAIEADRRAKGQTMTEWAERAYNLALEQSSVKYRIQQRRSEAEHDSAA